MNEETCIPWSMPQRIVPKRMNVVLTGVVLLAVVEKILS